MIHLKAEISVKKIKQQSRTMKDLRKKNNNQCASNASRKNHEVVLLHLCQVGATCYKYFKTHLNCSSKFKALTFYLSTYLDKKTAKKSFGCLLKLPSAACLPHTRRGNSRIICVFSCNNKLSGWISTLFTPAEYQAG